jgi:hypothetical protein
LKCSVSLASVSLPYRALTLARNPSGSCNCPITWRSKASSSPASARFPGHIPQAGEALVDGQDLAVGRHHQDAFVRGFQGDLEAALDAFDAGRQRGVFPTRQFAQQLAQEGQADGGDDARRHQTGEQVVGGDAAHQQQIHHRHDQQGAGHGKQGEQRCQAPAGEPLQHLDRRRFHGRG